MSDPIFKPSDVAKVLQTEAVSLIGLSLIRVFGVKILRDRQAGGTRHRDPQFDPSLEMMLGDLGLGRNGVPVFLQALGYWLWGRADENDVVVVILDTPDKVVMATLIGLHHPPQIAFDFFQRLRYHTAVKRTELCGNLGDGVI